MTRHSNPAPGLIAELASRPRWLIAGLVVAILVAASRFVSVGVVPPSLKVKQLTHATATTELLVGMPSAERASTYRDTYATLAAPRAEALADLMSSPQLRRLIASAAGIPAGQLAVDTPVWGDVFQIQQWPSREKRDSQIILEGVPYRITVDVDAIAPIIDIATQAPTPAEAVALAAASGRGLNEYLTELQTRSGTPRRQRYGVSQLVSTGVSPAGRSIPVNVAVFTFASILFIWCGAMLFLSGLAGDLRVVRARAKVLDIGGRSSIGRAALAHRNRALAPRPTD